MFKARPGLVLKSPTNLTASASSVMLTGKSLQSTPKGAPSRGFCQGHFPSMILLAHAPKYISSPKYVRGTCRSNRHRWKIITSANAQRREETMQAVAQEEI